MTWAEFKTKVREFLPTDAGALNVDTPSIVGGVSYLENLIRQAVIDLQRYIETFRIGHETIFTQDDLTEEGQASLGQLPDNAILRQMDYVKLGQPCVRQPLSQYPWENRFDLICGNIRTVSCQYAIAIDPQLRSFVVYPKVESNRQLSLIWDAKLEKGKSEFVDDEGVPFSEASAFAVSLFVSAHLRLKMDQDATGFKNFMDQYVDARTNLYLAALESTKLTSHPSPQVMATCALTQPDDTEIEFIAFGDSGEIEDDTASVAALVKALEPDIVIHMGDLAYPVSTAAALQEQFTKHYGALLLNELIYHAPGETDLADADGATARALMSYLDDLNSGKLYYTFAKGFVRFFVLNGNLDAGGATVIVADGVGVGSAQAIWLQAALAVSTEAWNIVVLHHAPYSSGLLVTPGVAAWRLPFLTWGADLVISAHAHNAERFLVDGLNYYVCGLGGSTKEAFGVTIGGSQMRYVAKNAVLRGTASETRLQLNLIDVNGQSQDTVKIT